MKIAQVAPLGERVPPEKYGGTERFIHTLTEGLVRKGHDVTLFASGDSKTSARLASVYPKALRDSGHKNPYGAEHLAMLNIVNVYKHQAEFDIIHDHSGYISLPTATLATTPVIMTLHGAASADGKRLYEGLNSSNNPYFVSISYSQRRPVPSLNYIANVYHGVNISDYKFSSEEDGYLLYVGRISEEKGVHFAIEVAEFLDIPLIIAAKVDPFDMPYFNEFIKPKLSEKIKWVGEVNTKKRNELMSRALCFLHPVMWREPFGLTVIESMASGTPVVAFGRGSIPEIIRHGKTGFIAEDLPEMIEYVRKVKQIKRKACREHVKEHFNAERMISEYEDVYRRILSLTRPEQIKSKRPPMPGIH